MRRLVSLLLFVVALTVGGLPARAVDIQRVVSPLGIEAWLVRDATLPLVALEFRFRGGSASGPGDRRGAGALAVDLLREGAGDLDAAAYARALDDDSISIGFSIGGDTISGGMRVLNEKRARGVELLRLALTAPRFDPAAVERVRARQLAGYARESEEPRAQARRAFMAAAFPDHPYGRDLDSLIAGTRAATAEEMRAFLAQRMARENLLVGVVGDIMPEELAPMLDALFGALPARAAPAVVPDTQPSITSDRTIVIRRQLPQSIQVFGGPGIKREDPDWFAALLVNYVLGGGGFNSRLMTEVREKRGLTYGVSTGLSPFDHAALVIGGSSTENARAGQALDIIRKEWRRMGEEGPTAEELENAKAYVTGSFPLSLDSSASIARLLVSMQYDRLPIDYLQKRDQLVRAVTIEDARRVARRLFAAPGLLTVIVGEPQGIVDSGG